MEKFYANEPAAEIGGLESQKEVYKNALAELDVALKEKLNVIVELPSFEEAEENFDFGGATKAIHNFLQTLKYFEERGKDLKGVISNVSFGPELAFDTVDDTLILSPNCTAAQIEAEIEKLNPPEKEEEVSTPEYSPEAAYRSEFMEEKEESLAARISERIASGAKKGYEKFITGSKEIWSYVPPWQRLAMLGALITSSGIHLGDTAYKMTHKEPVAYSDSQSTEGRKPELQAEAKASAFSKLKKWMNR